MLKKYMEDNDITLEELLNSIKVGIYVTDGEGNTLALNDECCENGSLERDEVVGKSMGELLSIGYVEESDSLKVMESGKEESFIQNLGDGGKIFITGVPIYKKGKIKLIVSTERDISEVKGLENILKSNEGLDDCDAENLTITGAQQKEFKHNSMIAVNPTMRRLLDYAQKIGKSDATVIITGESGTGKEMFADYIFQNSMRKEKPFIKINCGAIPESLIESELFGYESGAFTGAEKEGRKGIFEAADGGTVFLDEIGELSLQMQVKLLRTLQEKEIRRIGSNETISVDVRVITATNINLKKAVQEGKFREDLYYRLNIISIEVPPLRNRKEDIRPLALAFTEHFNMKFGISKRLLEEAVTAMEEYHWPGNIRELRNVMERIMINYDGDVITKFQALMQIRGSYTTVPDLLPEQGLKYLMEEYEKDILITYYEKCSTGKELSKILGVDEATISRKLRKYNIK